MNSICYWEVFRHFRGGGEFSAGGNFHGDNFQWGRMFQVSKLSKGSFTLKKKN